VRRWPAGNDVSKEAKDIIGTRHQATTSEDRILNTCRSEKYCARISENIKITRSYESQEFNKSNYQSKPRV
jgi:hypothetical protein